MPNDNLFSQTYDQIIKGALGGDDKYFQMLGNPQSFAFGTMPSGQTSPAAYQIASQMPDWSPIGNFAAKDSTFSSAYQQVFPYITWKVSPDQEQAQKDLQSNVNAKDRALTSAIGAANSAYLVQQQNGGVFFQNQYPTLNDWMAGPGATYQKAIDDATQAMNEATAQLVALQKAAMPDTLQNAMDAMTKPTGNPATTNAPAGWTKVPDSGGIIRFKLEYVFGTSGEDWRAELSKGTQGAFTVEINASDNTSNLNKSWAGASGGYSTPFWGVSGSGGWEKLDIADDDKSLSATISVKSSTLVPVSPSDVWYDGGFMSSIAKQGSGNDGGGWKIASPWVAKGGQGSKSLFGQYGLLSTRVSGLLVVYQPSYEITMSESTYQRNYQKIEAGGGLRIGPFHFGGHGGSEKDYQHSTNNKNSFTGGSTSTDPLILGVTVAFPGVDAP